MENRFLNFSTKKDAFITIVIDMITKFLCGVSSKMMIMHLCIGI